MDHHHVIRTGLLALGLGILAASPSLAQQQTTTGDAAYCARLAAMYNRYLADSTPSMETISAQNQCSGPNAAQAIASLEKLLQSKGYKLPERSVGQQN
ncbi:hypothetical protein [Vineibacter terrae]|uniref:Uncharacterized protein n=1 Tax=Vineibacter terrae TaxID=2586908 RepID=A0A5C8PCG1_9HYPH|nr:hypothetical protein [Vineibacter terrae]TXL71481.1 hypothetical protein FHP25_30085 [Vineibacter terrae]HEX2886506.1 hypothetical protein [Vineibacter terrae]